MFGIPSLVVAQPLLLSALAGLPLLWWWMRSLPPPPRRISFPAISLIGKVRATVAQTRPPLWLMLLRLVLVACLILGASGPVWMPPANTLINKDLILIIDNGWQGASGVQSATEIVKPAFAATEAARGQVAILGTAQPLDGWPAKPALQYLSSDLAERQLADLIPQSWTGDRGKFVATFGPLLRRQKARLVWLSDGTDPASAAAMSQLGSIEAAPLTEAGPLAIRNVVAQPEGYLVDIIALAAPRSRQMQVLGRKSDGAIGGSVTALLPAGATHVEITVPVPPADRIGIKRLEIAGVPSAAAVYLPDNRDRRPVVGLATGESIEERQPFRAANFYVKRALETHADVYEGSIDTLLKRPVNVLVLTDKGALPKETKAQLTSWLNAGGLLLSFAGPRFAESGFPFAPVPLRPASRTMGGALTWGTPGHLGSFPPASPLADIPLDANISVARQVLAQPTTELSARTWARLTDGTPLITAARIGNGLSVLVHTTASPEWTDLPLSGLFEQILQRVISLAGASAGQTDASITGPLVLESELKGDGSLGTPVRVPQPVQARAFEFLESGPRHPPGLYRSGNRVRALNLANANGPIGPRFNFTPIKEWPAGIHAFNTKTGFRAFGSMLWRLALVLLMADSLATLFIRGRLPRMSLPVRRLATIPVSILVVLLSGTVFAAPPAAAIDVQLAYVTGPSAAAVNAGAALSSLGDALAQRTAIHPAQPNAVIPGRDALGLYSVIYWPVAATAEPLDGTAAEAVAHYLDVGGIVIFDTASAGDSPSSRALVTQRMLSSISLPRLEPLKDSHVLAKSFYLLSRGPAHQLMSQLWIESGTDGSNGRVSSVIIGNQNLARSLLDRSPDSPVHEAAIRFGINAVMYALTGTYKADQVHAGSLMKRLRDDEIQIKRIKP
jgi:Domain of unknown function (DUF4159)/Aerotolerance regulator N-terminal